jgi:hypothetical protein
MDFEYKKYSLENLEKWMSDALLSSEATPQEIYDIIRKVVEEEYHYFKHHTGRCYELLALLNGNGKGHLSCDRDDPSEECKNAWTSFWEENYYPEEYEKSKEPKVEDIMPPWGHSDMEALRYTEEELNAMCDKAASDDEKEKCREYNLREAEYYNKRAKLDADYEEIKKAGGYDWTLLPTKNKVKKWVLPVEETKIAETDEIDYFITFPDDLLEVANLKEGDSVEWIDQGDGSYLIKKSEERKIATYDEMVAAGYTMTADGFWIIEPSNC